MEKQREIADKNSCLNRAAKTELVFVLLARDIAAPFTIRQWVAERIRLGKNKSEDNQIIEALSCADRMERFGK